MIDYLWSIGPVVSLFFGSTPIIGETAYFAFVLYRYVMHDH